MAKITRDTIFLFLIATSSNRAFFIGEFSSVSKAKGQSQMNWRKRKHILQESALKSGWHKDEGETEKSFVMVIDIEMEEQRPIYCEDLCREFEQMWSFLIIEILGGIWKYQSQDFLPCPVEKDKEGKMNLWGNWQIQTTRTERQNSWVFGGQIYFLKTRTKHVPCRDSLYFDRMK